LFTNNTQNKGAHMTQEMQMFHHGERHRKVRNKRQYWFRCLHDLKKDINLELMRSTNTQFTIFVGHRFKPLTVMIKKIKHLCKSRHGNRVQLELAPIFVDGVTLKVIYNKDNQTMVVQPLPKCLLK